jgi:hypothetical protein
MNSSDGQDFLDEIIEDDPNAFSYSIYPGTGKNFQHYDFKHRGNNGRKGKEKLRYYYRGSVNSDGEIGSARDFGNIGAGIVAGRTGMAWRIARLGFDGYQGETEPTTTQKAQEVGYKIGRRMWRLHESQRQRKVSSQPFSL